MSRTSFYKLPKWRFVFRMSVPSLVIFFLGLILMGVLAVRPELQGHPKIPSAMVKPQYEIMGDPFMASVRHNAQMIDYLFNVPEVCSTGKTVSEFQHQQCEDFWNRLLWGLGLSSIPFLLVLIFLMMGLDQLRANYRSARKKIDTGKAVFSGIVTEPAEAPNGFFAWFFCLRTISVQLSNGSQIHVYVPLDEAIPLPGQTLAIFDWGRHFGSQRCIAILYAPHMAVIGG